MTIRNKLRLIGRFSPNAQRFLIYSLLQGLNFSIYLLFFNLFILARGIEKDFLGLLAAIPSAIGLLFAFPAGTLSDRIGRRRALVLGTLLSVTSTAGIIFFTSPAGLILAALLRGCGQTLAMVSSAPFMMENSSATERTALFSANAGLSTLVGFVGNLIGGFLPAVFAILFQVDPESVPAYQGVLAIVMLVDIAGLIPLRSIEEKPPAAREQVADQRQDQPQRTRLPLGLIFKLLIPNATISIGAALLMPYMNVFFKEQFAISDSALGTMFSISSLFVGLAILAAPRLEKLLGKIYSTALTELLSIPFLLIIGFSPLLPLATVAFWIRAALMNMGNPLYSAFAMEQVDENARARVSSLMGMGWNIGWSVGPYISGLLQVRVGFSPIFLITTGTYVLGALATILFFGRVDPIPKHDKVQLA